MFCKSKLPYLFSILTFVLSSCNEGGDRSIINMADKGSGMFGVIAVTLLVLFLIVAFFLDRRGKNKKKDVPKDGNKV